ncbi:hypothetical protein DTO271G3_4925 [Paecilomyces variotii]|nr:hypothetical protein DTO271G3_4925 [Paecilomyces variotii]
MAPAAQDDIDVGSRASDFESQDSPLRRQFSEPLHPLSNSMRASPSPTPSIHRAKCSLCGKIFESTDEDPYAHEDALHDHIAAVHPQKAKFASYDGAGDDDEEEAEAEAEYVEMEDEHADEADNIIEEDEDAGETPADGTPADETPAINTPLDETPIDDPDVALSNQLHEFSRHQQTASVEKRLASFWNIHDVRNFSFDFDDEVADLEHTWDYVYRESKRTKKRDSPELPNRPGPYESPSAAKGEFLKITPIEAFLELLRDPESKSHDELYAVTCNVAHALKVWQDEYLAIDRLSKEASRHMLKKTANPRKTENPDVFEDKKESMLYGYKYDPKEPKISNQDPFVQGGFKPTAAQMRKMTAQAGPDNPNPDGWKPVVKFGVEHVPRFQNPPIEHHEGKATRKRKAALLEAAAAAKATESPEAAAAADDEPAPAPEPEKETEAPPAKRQTRSRGGKNAATREVLQTQTAPPSPAPSRRGGYAGRGGRRARGVSSTPQPPPVTPARASARTSTRIPGTATIQPPVPLQARPSPAPTATPAPPAQPIAPATSAAPVAATPTAAPTNGVLGGTDATLDPVELARRQKIANSKNPKRTEAMLNHWAKFNREGRIRNPKRTKAQIEADRAAEATKKTATEQPKPGSRKRKSSGAPTTPTSAASTPGIAPATTPVVNGGPPVKKTKLEPAVSQPVQPMPAPNTLPLPPANAILRPYGPHDPITIIPHGYASGPPVNLPPPPPQSHPQGHPVSHAPPHPQSHPPPPHMAYAPHPGYPGDYYYHHFVPAHHPPPPPPPAHHGPDGRSRAA